MKTLYFDCFSGISGDMTIGALLDLGVGLDYLKAELGKLPVEGYDIQASRVVRANLSAMKFDVLVNGKKVDQEHEPHDHGHHHDHDEGDHSHPRDDHHSDHHHHHKASEILGMIRQSTLNANTKRIAENIFMKLAISEGKVHHISPEDVEFHEVGAVDSIVDTVGSAIGFDALGVDRFACSPINVGSGFIHCQHGIYPVPAPATADLLRNATIYSKFAATELVTPTGAAILAAVVGEFGPMRGVSIEQIGYGAGTKQFQDFPNCLRLMVCSDRKEEARLHEPPAVDTIVVIEANIDDMTPQNLGFVTERLLEAGALDVCAIPALMKKGRAGHLLQVLTPPNRREVIERLIFRETTTIGLRHYAAARSVLEREIVEVETIHGKVRVKVSKLDGEVTNVAPEYEDCARIAREKNVPLKEVQSLAVQTFRGK
jgi:pyridinium-3,5-bisthiocarboxylic acid mononucleotide nickel chelatase